MFIGIDIGGTNIKYGLVAADGRIVSKGIMPTRHAQEDLLADLEGLVNAYKANTRKEILGVGISAPGTIKANGLMLTAGAIKPMYGVNLKEVLEARINLPVNLINDGNAVAIAEHWLGNAVGVANYICVVLGTGMGGGIVINNQLYSGAHGMAGEFGYMVTQSLPEDPTAGIEPHSLNFTSTVISGICTAYNEALLSSGVRDVEVTMDAREIMARASNGDAIARGVLDRFYENISIGLLNLVSFFDPEVVIIGGGISANDTFIQELTLAFEKVQRRHDSVAFLMGKTIAGIKPAKLTNDAGMLGAVYQLQSVMGLLKA
ncbi:ROK family protein [Fundicoccus sp. Sow4_D5]|uniref:ROK family protein n=1 Tax=Fundicoccus sp. Sow4_D5 TaxID=3438782 RepID=UPI003F92FEE8